MPSSCVVYSFVMSLYYSPIWNSYSIFDIHDFQIFGRSNGEGNGNPLQYSCLENPMEEDPGGLQSMGSQIFGLASYQVPCDFNVLISWNVNTVHLIKSTSANFFFLCEITTFSPLQLSFWWEINQISIRILFLKYFLSSLVFLDWINYYYDGYLTVLFQFHYYFLPLSVAFYCKEYLSSHSFTSVSTHELLFNQQITYLDTQIFLGFFQ